MAKKNKKNIKNFKENQKISKKPADNPYKNMDGKKKKPEPFFRNDNGILLKLPKAKRIYLLGEMVSLLMASKLHRSYYINDIGSVFLPPIHLNQFRVYRNKDKDAVGLVTWAYLSKEVEAKYLTQKYFLQANDWNSGDRLWAIDFLAPFGHMQHIFKDLRNNIFPDAKAKFFRFDQNGKCRGVFNCHGAKYQSNLMQQNKVS